MVTIEYGDIQPRIVGYAAVAGILVVLYTFLIPLFQNFGGGVVAGLICGYRVGGRGGLEHGLIAGLITGVFAGGVAIVPGWLVGLFLEPNSLLTSWLGLLSPTLDITTVAGLVVLSGLLMIGVTLDAVLGAVVGALVRVVVQLAPDVRR